MGRSRKELKGLEKEYDKLNKLAKEIESEISKETKSRWALFWRKMAWPVPGYTRISFTLWI